jgi:peptidyl-prolyl cis-trans isomerase SurA
MRYKINYLKIFLFIIFFSFNYIKNLNAEISNNIVVMVGDEMITSYDLEQEKLYLSLINQININSLNKKQLDDMAKDSLIREKVKSNVINKQKNLVIDDDFISINIKQVYKKLGLNSLDELKYLINKYNLNYEEFVNKITIELKWNQIIYSLFSNKIQIDKDKIDKKISLILNENEEKEFLISEIFLIGKNKKELNDKIIKVQESILEIGFNNTAIKYSSSDTSKNGGELGWVGESQISGKILGQIKITNTGNITQPIELSGGNLIIQVKNKRNTKKKIDIKQKFDEIVKAEQNYQLNNFSIYYFQKIKNNIVIRNN